MRGRCFAVGCLNTEILVPWYEDVDVVAVGLWPILSKDEYENKPFLKIFKHTTPSALYLQQQHHPTQLKP